MVKTFLFYAHLFFISCSSIAALEGFDFATLTQPADFAVIVKNVGQGSCSILKNKLNNKRVIIDAGSSANAPLNLDEKIVEEFDEASISADIPFSEDDTILITSHTDKDHIERFHRVFAKNAKLLSRLSHVFLGDHLENYYKSAETKEFLKTVVGNLNDLGKAVSLSHAVPITESIVKAEAYDAALFSDAAYRGYCEHVPIEGFLDESQKASHLVEFLSTNAGAHTEDLKDENTNSAIVRLSINGQNILVMGDATGLTTRRLLLNPANKPTLEAALLVASHHGAKEHETNNGLWLSIEKPKRVAISAGFRDVWFHPRAEFILDLMIVNSSLELKDDILGKPDAHSLALSGSEANAEFYKSSLSPFMVFAGSHLEYPKWMVFKTIKCIHSTALSGDLTYTYNSLGQVVDFYRQF
jgi:beta-lactamase superfamily II metal-dependent hydrolase